MARRSTNAESEHTKILRFSSCVALLAPSTHPLANLAGPLVALHFSSVLFHFVCLGFRSPRFHFRFFFPHPVWSAHRDYFSISNINFKCSTDFVLFVALIDYGGVRSTGKVV